MIVKPILSRFFAVLVSFSLLFAAAPAFAVMDCCDPVNMVDVARHVAADQRMNSINMTMQVADEARHVTADQQKNMPCKMPVGSCTSACASMATVALTAPQVDHVVPAILGASIWNPISVPRGITRLPALPPPISLT